ncbi:N-acetylglucosamine-specific PTS transporter subunit IIBC [Alkaliphilus peptidifermentans]|uniref:PTS system, N-acetylglucosamine-specific IIC component n=1 Tax=Alkaliphilus peptidifermentans DSM 18978 TaxID=1120976 RepID=A0A1G5BK85_9FIRM|nr:N-acetylglucosamine-specific PTS transporter subunit IIBC [Alkaliphilus peptidifermentans]SCX90581.1 PTS system, N-acetylglucosamine-specific IIC component [Alkaliphilus peptidifermentans DSM 18978]
MGNFFGKLQKLGKAMMLPVAVMPVASILLRIGQDDLLGIPFISAAGSAVFANLAILFAIGIAVGLAKDNAGAAGLAGAVGYFTLTSGATAINSTVNMGVLAGIISGIIAGILYNKYHNIKLPEWLGFFGGRRFVPIVTSWVCIVLAIVFGNFWPYVQNVIDAVGQWIIGAGALGVFTFGFLNRLLIPVGLHHILNTLVWFIFGDFAGVDGAVVTGDLSRFFAGDPTAGAFMAGFYPVMMFGLVGVALAIYTTAKPENRKTLGGALFSVGFTSFLTGITEPIEFMFMFLAPVLYVLHALLTGVSFVIVYILNIKHGFGFSAGLFDFALNMKLATNGWMLLPIGLIFLAIYYVIFVFAIKKMNLPTPGRLDEEGAGSECIIADKGIHDLAKEYIAKLGGADNIIEVDSCITRLRLTLKDSSIVKDEELRALGASGVLRPSKKNMQVVVGTKAELIAEEMKNYLITLQKA